MSPLSPPETTGPDWPVTGPDWPVRAGPDPSEPLARDRTPRGAGDGPVERNPEKASRGRHWPARLAERDLTKGRGGSLQEACAFLTAYLASGPRPATDVLKAAKDAGIKERTLYRAKRDLKVKSDDLAGEGCLWIPA